MFCYNDNWADASGQTRWQTGNAYTQYSALYPYHFGWAMGIAQSLVLNPPASVTEEMDTLKSYVHIMLAEIPPMPVIIARAEDM